MRQTATITTGLRSSPAGGGECFDAIYDHRLDGDGTDRDDDTGTVLKEHPADPKLEKPPLYKVILLNDDYTPMGFVVEVLMRFFGMNEDKAVEFMYAVHTTGSAVVGIFPRDLAETKSEQVNSYAQEHDHPLKSTVEMTD